MNNYQYWTGQNYIRISNGVEVGRSLLRYRNVTIISKITHESMKATDINAANGEIEQLKERIKRLEKDCKTKTGSV